MTLAILDLGCGNLGSVAIAFERFGMRPVVTADAAVLVAAERVVLPGQGRAGYAAQQLRAHTLHGVVAALKQPVLGICLGMQLLFERTEEDGITGLGLIPGQVRALQPAPQQPVPHMGWSRLDVQAEDIGIRTGDYVYFAHSYACDDGPWVLAAAEYGRSVPAVVRAGNFTGAQFHPEKSGAAGARFLEAWLAS